MNVILRNRTKVFVFWALFAIGCGSHTKANDPLPETGTQTQPTLQPPNSIGPTSPPPAVPTETSVGPTLTPAVPTNPGPGNATPTSITNVPVMGKSETLEIGCWNIENFPKASGSKEMVATILNKMDVDVMSLSEISGSVAFNDLLGQMPAFGGVIASQGSTQEESQNVGIIYRKSDFTLVSAQAIFENDSYSFPRPPLMMRLKPVRSDRRDFVVIGVHLKAFGDEKSQQRREMANEKLEQFASSLKAKEPNLQIILVGDFNQPLDEPSARKVFDPWFNSGAYTVRTDALYLKGDYSYYSTTRLSLIDHMISSNDFLLTEPVIPKLQNIVPGYATAASDHLPLVTTLIAP